MIIKRLKVYNPHPSSKEISLFERLRSFSCVFSHLVDFVHSSKLVDVFETVRSKRSK